MLPLLFLAGRVFRGQQRADRNGDRAGEEADRRSRSGANISCGWGPATRRAPVWRCFSSLRCTWSTSRALVLIPPLLLVFYITMRRRSAGSRTPRDTSSRSIGCTCRRSKRWRPRSTPRTKSRTATSGASRSRALGAGAGSSAITDEPTLQAIEAAALLHDTGKIAVPEHILNKPGKLTPAEFEQMKLHVDDRRGHTVVDRLPVSGRPHRPRSTTRTGTAPAIRDGINGEEIPIGARILSVVDCFDALTSDRPYRRADDRTTKRWRFCVERRGTMYDPAIVDTFVRVYERIMPRASRADIRSRKHSAKRRAPRFELADAAMSAGIEAATSEVLAVSSLARAVSGEATIADVGALTWMMLRQVVPCSSMGIFVYDEKHDAVILQYADGAHAVSLRGARMTLGAGIAGWSAANRRFVLNGDPGDRPRSWRGLTVSAAPIVVDCAAGSRRQCARRDFAVRVDGGSVQRRSRPAVDAARAEPRDIDASVERARPEPRRMASGEFRLLKR